MVEGSNLAPGKEDEYVVMASIQKINDQASGELSHPNMIVDNRFVFAIPM